MTVIVTFSQLNSDGLVICTRDIGDFEKVCNDHDGYLQKSLNVLDDDFLKLSS